MISPDDLTPEQQAKIHEWAAEGVSLGEIQSRLGKDYGVKATYMEMHLLMIDLKVELPDEEEDEEEEEVVEPVPESAAPAEAAMPAAPPASDPSAIPAPGVAAEPAVPVPEAAPPAEGDVPAEPSEAAPPAPGDGSEPPPELPDDLPAVTVNISELTRPGMMAGGTVTFADTGDDAEWYMDQFGRLGMNPTNPEFEPSEKQVMAFQMELQRIARERGMM